MQFTGQITEVKAVSGNTRTTNEPYSGVELTIIEPREEGKYNNKATVYVSGGTEQQYHIGDSVNVQCNIDIRMGRDGIRKYNSIACYLVKEA